MEAFLYLTTNYTTPSGLLGFRRQDQKFPLMQIYLWRWPGIFLGTGYVFDYGSFLGPFSTMWSKALTIFKRKAQLLKPLNSFTCFNVLILNNFTSTSKAGFKETMPTYNPSIILCVLLNSFNHRSILCAYISISLKGITASVEVP